MDTGLIQKRGNPDLAKDATVHRWRQVLHFRRTVIMICLIVLLHIFYCSLSSHTYLLSMCLFVYLCFTFVLEPFTINEISSTAVHVFTFGTLRQFSNTVAFSIAQCITQCFGQGTTLFLEKIPFKLPETTGPKLKAHVCVLHHL